MQIIILNLMFELLKNPRTRQLVLPVACFCKKDVDSVS